MDTAQAAVRAYEPTRSQSDSWAAQNNIMMWMMSFTVCVYVYRTWRRTDADKEDKSEKTPAMAQVSTDVQINNIILITHNAHLHQLDNGTDPSSR